MIKFVDKLRAITYRLLSAQSSGSFNCCSKCKKYPKNYWNTISFKPNYLIGYDYILAEWVLFQDNNVYAKVFLMNEYLTNTHILTEKIWSNIYSLCSRCIAQYFVSHKNTP